MAGRGWDSGAGSAVIAPVPRYRHVLRRTVHVLEPPRELLDEPPDPEPLPPDPLAGVHWPALSAAPRGSDVHPPAAEPEDHDLPDAAHRPGGRPLSSDELATVEPGLLLAAELELARALERTSPATVDEYHLVELVAGYQRMASWCQSRMTELAGRLARRPALNPQSPMPGNDAVINVTAEELAPRLGLTRFAARRYVENARLFRLKLEDTGEALRTGRIDFAKASAVVRLLKDQPGDVAWEVQQIVLPDAPVQTVLQLERAVSKAIIAVDPHRATARHRKARESRRVGRPKPLPDGMASLFAILPATDAAGLDLALEAAARTAKASGDTRTLEQLRADALALLGHGALERGYIGASREEAVASSEAAPTPTERSTAPVKAAPTPTESAPAPVVASVSTTAPALDTRDPAAPESGTGDPPLDTGNDFLRTLHMPIGTIGGHAARLHVTVPLSVLLPPEILSHGAPRGDSHAADQPPGDRSASTPSGDGAERLTEASEATEATEDGLPDDWYPGPVPAEVAELDGYGPITPDVALALAYSGGTWQRLVTDPLSGVLLDVGRTSYRPPAAIADFVRLRDRTCIGAGCTIPARRCQLDHITSWHEGGTTSSDNLGPSCGRDHTVKTTGAFRVEHLGAGTFEWTTPSGHRYRREASGRITHVRRSAAGHAGEGPPVSPPFPDEPPF